VVAFLFLKSLLQKEDVMPINKTQLNKDQIKLAQNWLPDGNYPYGHNGKLLWFYDDKGRKNALKLSPEQIDQLNQLG